MSKIKYVYNPNTLQFEEHKVSTKEKLQRIFGVTLMIVFSGALMYMISDKYLPSPKQMAMEREIQQMEYHYQDLVSEYEKIYED